ncbi:phosphonate ABC transporter ATP-binding protein [Fulvimarina endophytica]|uniref:Phosphonate ABC transporter ATP-binding protein n=1 Tax=Fulvimarina endophytica TaxID=2293836 RepID=A0A371X5W8_9HYPH|nr:phosphonate ABC transporter ATP-binding protein [Fulvimarina endophytica]RFC64434.1 phosphonate ABC transporter ATP-binding protein [Fulvimarina endophytica]
MRVAAAKGKGEPAALEAEGLWKRFGERQVLRGASLEVAAGEFVALLGPSGAGKSTLFRCLTRLEEPDKGTIRIAGHPFHDLYGRRLADARRSVGVVFQQFNLVRRLSALDNVLAGRLATTPFWRVALRRFTEEDRERAALALDRVGLLPQAHQRADTLSGGQQQRVAIARAIAQGSRVLLADEPVASLDPANARRVLGLMRELGRETGLAVLCTLHQPDLAHEFGDRILRMEGGRVVPDRSGADFGVAAPVGFLGEPDYEPGGEPEDACEEGGRGSGRVLALKGARPLLR